MIIMALTENAQNYVDELTPLVKKYAEIYGYSPNVVPAIVAQSCYETGYGDMSNDIPRVAHNYFGIKHGGLNYYTGMTYDTFTGKLIPSENLIITPENRSHLWRAYDTMEDGELEDEVVVCERAINVTVALLKKISIKYLNEPYKGNSLEIFGGKSSDQTIQNIMDRVASYVPSNHDPNLKKKKRLSLDAILAIAIFIILIAAAIFS